MGDLITTDTEKGLAVLPEKQIIFYGKLLQIIDRRPSLNWLKDKGNHNDDFCLIEGQIEPTRTFTLKVQKVANYSMYAYPAESVVVGEVVNVSVRVRLWDDDGEVTATGGCSTIETAHNKSKRLFHDAVAIAETRAFKRALEAKAGLPFINLIIKELFGTFEAKGAPPRGEGPRDVTDSGNQPAKNLHPVKNVELANTIKAKIKKGVEDGMPEEWGRNHINRIKVSLDEYYLLLMHEKNVDQDLAEATLDA